MERKEELLRATYQFLKAVYGGPNEDALAETAFYDGVECDGYCLLEDIAAELNLPSVN